MTTNIVTDLIGDIPTTTVTIENDVRVNLDVPVILSPTGHIAAFDTTQYIIVGYTPNYHGELGLYLRTTTTMQVSYVTKTMKDWVAFFMGRDIDHGLFQKEWSYLNQSIFQYL